MKLICYFLWGHPCVEWVCVCCESEIGLSVHDSLLVGCLIMTCVCVVWSRKVSLIFYCGSLSKTTDINVIHEFSFIQFYFVLAALSNTKPFRRPLNMLFVDLVHSSCYSIIEKFKVVLVTRRYQMWLLFVSYCMLKIVTKHSCRNIVNSSH